MLHTAFLRRINNACAAPLIDGQGYEYAFTRGVSTLVGRGESDTG